MTNVTIVEVAVELRGLRDLLLEKIEGLKERLNERDRLYGERELSNKEAVKAALAAADALTKATFEASERAVLKTETTAANWRDNANEWRGAMQDREVKFVPKPEMTSEIGAINKSLAEVKETQANLAGGKMYRSESRLNINTIVSVICMIVAVVSLIMLFVWR